MINEEKKCEVFVDQINYFVEDNIRRTSPCKPLTTMRSSSQILDN